MIMGRTKGFMAIVLLWAACLVTTSAQEQGKGETTSQKSIFEQMIGKLAPGTEIAVSPLEGPIDQYRYVVGPGDVLAVSVWGALNLTFTMPVTPEGTLIIPTIGELRVAESKLSEVKEKVSAVVKTKYLSANVTTTLIAPRTFIVTVTGSILNQGQYRAMSVDRVEKVVVQASRVYLPAATVTVQAAPKKEEPDVKESLYNDPAMNQVAVIFNSISTRNILLIRRSGDTVRVDIPKFYATRNDRYNPFLFEGDVVFVPRRALDKDFIAVYGAVNAPGKYEYVEGDSLFDALLIAQGTIPQSDLSKVSVNRLNDRGETVEELSLNILKDGPGANIRLRKGDRITVGELTSQRMDYRVQVRGEVRSPGLYPISLRGTKLSKIVELAGGFTEQALLSGAIVMRKQDQPFRGTDTRLDAARTLRSYRPQMADSAYYFLNTEVDHQPVAVDFVRLFQDKDSTQDIILQNDDIVYVPLNDQTVIVEGQVTHPGHQSFIPGADYRYYVSRAGGFSEYADGGETKIIKKATLEWMSPGDTNIESGDHVWVPRKPVHEFQYYFGIFRDVITLAAAVVTTIYLVRTFK